MNWTTVSELASFVANVATATAAIAAVVIYRRQARLQNFLEYTRRFDEVMCRFPPEYRGEWQSRSFDPADAATRAAVVAYLNLCAEEHHLMRLGLLDRAVWRMWELEIIAALTSPYMRVAWRSVCGEFKSSPEFYAWVEELHARTVGAP